MKKDKITIYTDGAAKGNPGPAGWGAVILFYPHPASPYGRGRSKKGVLEIVSDSKYVILGITEWIFNWQKNNWRNAAKKPVLNKELWEELYELTQELQPKWTYVKGHNDHEHNERADLIATSNALGEPVELKNAR